MKEASPAALAANVNDYNPGNAVTYRMDAGAVSRKVTGLNLDVGKFIGDQARVGFIRNIGNKNLTFKHEDPDSLPEDRLSCDGGEDIICTPDKEVGIRYGIAAQRWKVWLVGIGARFNAGTYIGDGSISQAITGIGFEPDYVRIWQRETEHGNEVQVFETTPEIMDDNVEGGAIFVKDSKFVTNAIISIDNDGFTVDDDESDSHPNESGTVYNFMVTRKG